MANKSTIAKATDEELIVLIENGVSNSVGDFLNSSDLTRERLRATYEFAGLPLGEGLRPNGVSQIVDSSTTEVVEAYTSILSELILSNNKIARFIPYNDSVTARDAAKQASDMVNYCIFKKNNGWTLLSDWIKAALLWKNSIIRWDYVEDFEYMFHEYDEIDQYKLDEILADTTMEIVGDLKLESDFSVESETGEPGSSVVYVDVRVRETIDRSRVDVSLVAPENFRITRDATSIEDAAYIGIQVDMTRSEIRKHYPDMAEKIEDWDELGSTYEWNTSYTEEAAARKHITGQEYWQGSNEQELLPLDANREVTVTESWLRVDRDGDGIAELKHIITSGNHILLEEDVDCVNLASLCPISIPHEFFGLSIADFTRSSTLANTAIIRGFLENVYLTNYSPTLADPNVVDFGALQNMRPKQLIATNGNPAAAVQKLPPETISPGTTGILDWLQLHKEQATGMSKAAQGLNDTLYVSGNSEQKVQAVQTASQKRIQHIARVFTETGFKRLIEGVYKTMTDNMDELMIQGQYEEYMSIDIENLPNFMEVEVLADVGDHGNSTMLLKMQQVQALMEGLQGAGAGMVIKQEAPVVVAEKVLNALDLNPADFIEDWQDEEFAKAVAEAKQAEEKAAEEQRMMEMRNANAEISQKEANVSFTTAQAKNTHQDNTRQTAIAIDKHLQEWEKLRLEAMKDGAEPARSPDVMAMFGSAQEAVKQMDNSEPSEPIEKIMKILEENPQMIQQLMQLLSGGQNG